MTWQQAQIQTWPQAGPSWQDSLPASPDRAPDWQTSCSSYSGQYRPGLPAHSGSDPITTLRPAERAVWSPPRSASTSEELRGPAPTAPKLIKKPLFAPKPPPLPTHMQHSRHGRSLRGPREPRKSVSEDAELRMAIEQSKEEAAMSIARRESEHSEDMRLMQQAMRASATSHYDDRLRRQSEGKGKATSEDPVEDVEDPKEVEAIRQAMKLSMIDADSPSNYAEHASHRSPELRSRTSKRGSNYFVTNPDIPNPHPSANVVTKVLGPGQTSSGQSGLSSPQRLVPAVDRIEYVPASRPDTITPESFLAHSHASSSFGPDLFAITRAAPGLPTLDLDASPVSSEPAVHETATDDEGDPFDDTWAAEDDTIVLHGQTAVPYAEPSSPVSISDSLAESATSELTSPTSAPQSPALDCAGPTHGGFTDTASVNAMADEALLRGIAFGFVASARKRKRPALDYAGTFPDVAQLSRSGGLEGTDKCFECFAFEASSWNSLLAYLMWHGHSRIELAPYDLQDEKAARDLVCSVILDFYIALETGRPRTRCRLDLQSNQDPIEDCGNPVEEQPRQHSFDPDCPNVTIALPFKMSLPFELSTLATQLSAAHTFARQANADPKGSLADCKSFGDLPQAIDFYRKLGGERTTGIDASLRPSDTDLREVSTMQKLKFKLRRGKKAGRVRGAQPEGTPVRMRDDLPEEANLVTPFKLDDE